MHSLSFDTHINKYKNKTLLIFRHEDKVPEYVKNTDNIIILYAKDQAMYKLYLESNFITLIPVFVQYISSNILVHVNGIFRNVRSKYYTFEYNKRYTYEDVLTLTKTSDRIIADARTKPIIKDIVISDKSSLIINSDITL